MKIRRLKSRPRVHGVGPVVRNREREMVYFVRLNSKQLFFARTPAQFRAYYEGDPNWERVR